MKMNMAGVCGVSLSLRLVLKPATVAGFGFSAPNKCAKLLLPGSIKFLWKL